MDGVTPQAHRVEPESRLRWWLGAAAEMLVLAGIVLVVLAIGALKS